MKSCVIDFQDTLEIIEKNSCSNFSLFRFKFQGKTFMSSVYHRISPVFQRRMVHRETN